MDEASNIISQFFELYFPKCSLALENATRFFLLIMLVQAAALHRYNKEKTYYVLVFPNLQEKEAKGK